MADDTEGSPVLNEVAMLQRLGEFAQEADHPGLDFIRREQDIFEINGISGPHYCVVMKPQGPSLRTLQESFPNAIVPKLLVRSFYTPVTVLRELASRDMWSHTYRYLTPKCVGGD